MCMRCCDFGWHHALYYTRKGKKVHLKTKSLWLLRADGGLSIGGPGILCRNKYKMERLPTADEVVVEVLNTVESRMFNDQCRPIYCNNCMMVRTRSGANTTRSGRNSDESAGADQPSQDISPPGECKAGVSCMSWTSSGNSPQRPCGANNVAGLSPQEYSGMIRDSSGFLHPRIFTLEALASALLRASGEKEERAACPREVVPGAPSAPSNTASTWNVTSMTFMTGAPSPRTARGAERVAGHLFEGDASAPLPTVPPPRVESISTLPTPSTSGATVTPTGPSVRHSRHRVPIEQGVPKISCRALMLAGPTAFAKYKRDIKASKLRMGDRMENQFKAHNIIDAADKQQQPLAAVLTELFNIS